MDIIKKILWPTDFSRNAQIALNYVNSLAQKYKAEVHVLHVVEDIAHHEAWYGEFDQAHIQRMMKWEEETGRKRLDQICEKYLESCPLFIKHIAVGDPAQEILKTIEMAKIDTVIMPTRGHRGVFPFGSVAEKVVKSAKVPVITIPVTEGAPEAEPLL